MPAASAAPRHAASIPKKSISSASSGFYVSKGQINYQIPPGTANGPATVTIASSAGTFTWTQQIVPVSPGIYYVGSGLAAANVVTIRNGQVQSIGLTAQADQQGNFSLVPIDLGSDLDRVFLQLYATGLRHHKSPAIVNLGSGLVPATYAGAQGTYVGEDQINVQIPRGLRGAGVIDVSVRVDGQTTNAVKVSIK
jgi:uncharacterized protein (TIGR03437 family)